MNEQTKTEIEKIQKQIDEAKIIIDNRALEIDRLLIVNKADLKQQAVRVSTIQILTKLTHE